MSSLTSSFPTDLILIWHTNLQIEKEKTYPQNIWKQAEMLIPEFTWSPNQQGCTTPTCIPWETTSGIFSYIKGCVAHSSDSLLTSEQCAVRLWLHLFLAMKPVLLQTERFYPLLVLYCPFAQNPLTFTYYFFQLPVFCTQPTFWHFKGNSCLKTALGNNVIMPFILLPFFFF